MKEPVWIDEQEARIFHDRLLAAHGGPEGVRDDGLLKAALARPRQHAAYGSEHDIVFLASIYTAAIVSNHPFVDGNKRTGFLLGILFLELNGYLFHASQEDAANAMIALASGAIDEHAYARFLSENVMPAA